jgi:mono/diheme cytochrome c family protein
VATLAIALLLGGTRLSAQARPAGVTDSMLTFGREIYLGTGQCARCHGEQGEGTAEGEPLRAGTWKLGSGDYEWLTSIIRHSGVAARGRDGDPLAMRGPTLLSPDEIRAVAAYVWSISRDRVPKQ